MRTGRRCDHLLLEPSKEAEQILGVYGELSACLQAIGGEFAVLQQRTQLLLTLGTLSLTITGFSGPKIAASGAFARWSMAAGLAFSLAAMAVALLGTMRIRWITQFELRDPMHTLTEIITYRNAKTRLFKLGVVLLVLGLSLYVGSVLSYLAMAEPF